MRVENSFIGADGVGTATEGALWRAGVTHWDEFSGDVVGPTRAERIDHFIEHGRQALAETDAAFFERAFPGTERWRFWRSFRDQACAFDIETTGLEPTQSVVTTVTVHRGGETETLVRGDDLSTASLKRIFEDAAVLVSFNGKRFDVPFLEHHFDIELSHPHIDCMYTARKLGLTGGLDAVEDALGIDRSLPDVDGREAVRLWHAHEAGRDGALDRLVAYNREDAENLVALMDRAVDRLTPGPIAGTNE